jgi:hypothetical protein
VDAKTAEVVAFLFCYRGKRMGKTYLNAVAGSGRLPNGVVYCLPNIWQKGMTR